VASGLRAVETSLQLGDARERARLLDSDAWCRASLRQQQPRVPAVSYRVLLLTYLATFEAMLVRPS